MINDEAFKHWDSSAPGAAQQQTMDAESFMAAMEADCRERAERRKIAESVAEKLKLEGNELFQAGDYVKVVCCIYHFAAHLYSFGLEDYVFSLITA